MNSRRVGKIEMIAKDRRVRIGGGGEERWECGPRNPLMDAFADYPNPSSHLDLPLVFLPTECHQRDRHTISAIS